MSQNILFFSQNCQHSKKLLAKIINTPLYGNLQKVCVDDPQTRSRLPKWVSCVPLIYLAQAHPTFQNPLKDNDINMWIESQISQMQSRNQPPQQQFQQQNQTLNQQQQSQQQSQPPQQSSNQQAPTQQQQSLAQDSMGFEAYNSLEMGGGIASDNYSMFSKEDAPINPNLFPHSYETISGTSFGSQNPQPKGYGNAFSPPQQSNNQNNSNNLSSNSNDSRTSQKQEKFEQDLAIKKAMRDQDSVPQTNRKTDGVPQNFNQMWEQNNTF